MRVPISRRPGMSASGRTLPDVVAPGERVERAQQIRHEGRASAFAGVAGRAGELAEHHPGRMADDIGVLELGEVVLVVVIGRAVTASLGGRVGHAHRPDFQPRVSPVFE